ncbi:hypothetical protein M8J77_021164 [Diaphorina citri]|nr:hypothetical protein M8J77_021164 [Diaphorina citri]
MDRSQFTTSRSEYRSDFKRSETAASDTDRSHLYIVLLVESDSHLSPYVYHINDMPSDDEYFVLNDKQIFKSISKESASTTKSARASRVASGNPVSDTGLPENREVPAFEKCQPLVRAIKRELAWIETRLGREGSTTTLSSLVKRGKIKVTARRDPGGELFVLITTMYNPYLPKVLIESGVPIRAIVRLIHDPELCQQPAYDTFYENYVKEYPFRNKLKRSIPKPAGICREPTKALDEDIRVFWKTIDALRTDSPLTFRETIFVDVAIPYVDLHSGASLRSLVESYRTSLHEDIRSVQAKIRNIVRAHECHVSQAGVQNMRTVRRVGLDALTEYKVCLLTTGATVACVLHSVLEQVPVLTTDSGIPKPAPQVTLPSTASVQSTAAVQSEELADDNVKVFTLATVLLDLTNQLDDYYVLNAGTTSTNVINARDHAKLAYGLEQGKTHLWEITLELLRTYMVGLTQTHFAQPIDAFPSEFIEWIKLHISHRLNSCSPTTQKHVNAWSPTTHGKSTPAQSFLDKRFYLDYYLSLPWLETEPTCDTELGQDLIPDLKKFLDANLASGLDRRKETDAFKKDTEVLSINEEGSDLSVPYEYSNEDFQPNKDLKQTTNQVSDQKKPSGQEMKPSALFNYTENFASDLMVQLFFSRVTTTDRMSLVRLPVTGDLLLHCWNEAHATTEWKFIIPTVLGLHDFYHHQMSVMEESSLRERLACRTPQPASSQQSQHSSDVCQHVPSLKEMFVLSDSIKYELSKFVENYSEGLAEATGSSGEDEVTLSSEESIPPFKHVNYKYGIPQLIENQGSSTVYRFDETVSLRIAKNGWTYKNVDHTTVACRIQPRAGLAERSPHTVYTHTSLDTVRAGIISVDFHICLNSDVRIRFKRNNFPTGRDLWAESDEGFEIRENSYTTLLHTSLSSFLGVSSNVYEQGIELLHKFMIVTPDYFPIVSHPSGLTVDVTNENAFPFCITQYFTTREVLPRRIRKYLLNACVLVRGQNEGDILVMTPTGEAVLTSPSNVGPSTSVSREDGTVTWKTRSAEGNLYQTQNGRTLLEESTMKVTQRRNLQDNSMLLTREDGLRMCFCEDATLYVTYADGTRFTTTVTVEDTSEDYVLVSISVLISHDDYFTVVYNYREETVAVVAPEFVLKFHTDGTCRIQADAASSLTAGSEYVSWELTGHSGDVTDRCEFRLSPTKAETTLLTVHNGEKKIKVDCSGNARTCTTSWDVLDEVSSAGHLSMNSGNSVRSEARLDCENAQLDSSFLVLSSDLSGFEILSRARVESVVSAFLNNGIESGKTIIQELDTLCPYYFKLLSTVLSTNASGMTSLLRGIDLSGNNLHRNFKEEGNRNILGFPVGCMKPEQLPSTYGSHWGYPFHRKPSTACPLLTQSVAYRLFHRVTKGGNQIGALFLEALEDESELEDSKFGNADWNVEIPPEGSDLIERLCRGSVSLRSVTEDDVERMRQCVAAMINRAILLANVEWVTEQNERLLDVLARRPRERPRARGCSCVRLVGCEKLGMGMGDGRCFAGAS